jgi:hypothetical protein
MGTVLGCELMGSATILLEHVADPIILQFDEMKKVISKLAVQYSGFNGVSHDLL